MQRNEPFRDESRDINHHHRQQQQQQFDKQFTSLPIANMVNILVSRDAVAAHHNNNSDMNVASSSSHGVQQQLEQEEARTVSETTTTTGERLEEDYMNFKSICLGLLGVIISVGVVVGIAFAINSS